MSRTTSRKEDNESQYGAASERPDNFLLAQPLRSRQRRRRETQRSSSVGAKGESFAAIAFLAPSFIGISVFFLIPFVDTVRRSFYDARGKNFIGLDGYASVLNNSAFRLAAANTAKFVAVCIPLLLVVSLIVALLIRSVRPRGKAFKTTYLLPMAVPVASIVLLWQVMFHENGLANTVLATLGLQPVNFMGSSAAFWVLIFTYLWKNNGYDMILWLAGLDSISESLYEAARVDGANSWQCFWYITLPGLLPTVGLVAILSLLNGFKVFREAYLVAGSYPHDSIYLLQHLFNNWFQNLDISRLCAAATMLSLALLVIILIVQRFFREAD
ncbi:MAG: sugar ABC transporter permease [Oscillospiraceae bacterium]|jgi:multiple sugar transport system permease protein|nr:sugar ABC transporter permease [Oscillospiraceae bacterium]